MFARRRPDETNTNIAEGVFTARQRARRRRCGQLRPSEGLSRIRQSEGNLIISSKGRGFPEGLFAFASVDAATHAALCAVGLPSIAMSDKVNDEGLAIITRAFRDASLRSAARNGRRLRSADLTDADAFEALLEGSTLEEVPEAETDDISEVKTVEVAKPSITPVHH